MRHNCLRCLAAITLLALLCVQANAGEKVEDGWVSLFNGKDLKGWKPNIAPEAYSVVDGALRLHNPSERIRSHLFYVGDGKKEFVRFKDFDLKMLAKGDPGSNSGVFFHTDHSFRDDKKHLGKGYEVQLNTGSKDARGTGSLYSVQELSKVSTVDDTKWFELNIRVRGKRIVVRLNGKKVVDYTEPEKPERAENRKHRILDPMGGAIALQAHDSGSTWYFKDIKIRKLPDASKTGRKGAGKSTKESSAKPTKS